MANEAIKPPSKEYVVVAAVMAEIVKVDPQDEVAPVEHPLTTQVLKAAEVIGTRVFRD